MSSLPDELEKLSNSMMRLFQRPFRRIDRATETLLRRDIGRSIARRIEGLGARGVRALRLAIERFEKARSERARRKAYEDVLRALYGRKGSRVLRKAIEAGILSEEEVVELAKRRLRRKAARIRPARRERRRGRERKNTRPKIVAAYEFRECWRECGHPRRNRQCWSRCMKRAWSDV
ncbi:hypothetical protein [Pyrodictium delaneyi]|nr:hypothetical protein [Pyrodictium delaneyi]